MDERRWLTTRSPMPLLGQLHGRLTVRKFRLVGCGCVRASLADIRPDLAAVVDRLECSADGLLTAHLYQDGRDRAAALMRAGGEGSPEAVAATVLTSLFLDAGPALTPFDHMLVDEGVRQLGLGCGRVAVVRRRQAAAVRCAAGNPFHPVAFATAWRTPTVVAIAAGSYADRAFDRLPVLADALEDAGCDVAELLAHLRGPGPHARGCWPVDLALGKA